MRASTCKCPPCGSPTSSPNRHGDYTVYALPEGRYEFEYLLPSGEHEMLYGELDVHDPDGERAEEFIRRVFISISPGRPGGDPGFLSILTEDDLDRVRHGDMVTKVVFIADLSAVDRRLDMIEKELREIRDRETAEYAQLEYWKVKLADRRRDAFYSPECECHYWCEFNEAEGKVRKYEEKIAELDLPARRLREERAALRGILAHARVVCRQNEMMLATCSMHERYTDMLDQIEKERVTLQGPFGAMKMKEKDKEIGEVVMVMRLGGRMPVGR
jgi:hypothetical protein